VKRGAIFQYFVGGHRLRVAVISADRYNPKHGLVAPLRERTPPANVPAFLVPLGPKDWPTTAAVIDLSHMRALNPDAVDVQAGALTRDTLARLDLAVRTYLGGHA